MSSVAMRCNVPLASLEIQNSQIANFELVQAGAQVCTIAVLGKPNLVLSMPSACLLQANAGWCPHSGCL